MMTALQSVCLARNLSSCFVGVTVGDCRLHLIGRGRVNVGPFSVAMARNLVMQVNVSSQIKRWMDQEMEGYGVRRKRTGYS